MYPLAPANGRERSPNRGDDPAFCGARPDPPIETRPAAAVLCRLEVKQKETGSAGLLHALSTSCHVIKRTDRRTLSEWGSAGAPWEPDAVGETLPSPAANGPGAAAEELLSGFQDREVASVVPEGTSSALLPHRRPEERVAQW